VATQLKFDVTALDQASKTFVRIAQAVERFEKRLDQLDGKQVRADVEVNTDKADREIGAFATSMRRKLEAATKALPDIEIKADSTDAELALAAIRGDLAELRDATVGVDIDATLAEARIEEIGGRLRALAKDAPELQVRADAAAALAQLGLVDHEAEKLDKKRVTVKVDTDKSLGDSLIHVTRLTEALGKLALPAAAIAAAPQIAAIGSAAVTASGALALLPAAGLAGAVAITSLVMAFKGFGDAVSDDPKKAAEALAKLAPEAREAAVAVRGLAGDWGKVQQQVQNTAFKGIAEDLKSLSSSYLPAASTELVRFAGGFNEAAQGVAKFLTAPSVVRDVAGALEDAGTGATNATGAVEPLVRAIVDLASEGSTRLPRLGQAVTDVAEKFADWIDQARESGQLGEWIDGGIRSLQQLGSIAGNVGSSLMSVFKASKDSGADLLSTLDGLTGKLSAFLASAQGQNALKSLFTDIRDAVDAATPGVEKLVTAIAGVVQKLGDAGVLREAGEAFSAIADQVAPLIDLVGGLAGPLAGLLGIVGDLAPVLVPAAAALAGFWLAAKVIDGVGTISGKISGFTTAIGGIKTAAGEGGAMGAVKKLGTALGAGGVLGLALGAAGIALDLWATKNAEAKAAEEAHKSKVDELAGSFDKVSGAATEATRSIAAQELTNVKLKDGTTSLATALGKLGIDTRQWVDAVSGSVPAQQAIAERLNATTKAAIEQSPVWKNNAADVQRWGVSLDTVVAAANGNVQAQDQLTEAAKRNAGGVLENEAANSLLVNSLLGLGGTAGEVSSQFGAAIGTLKEAKSSFDITKQATADFAATLGTVKTGLAGLKDGSAPLPPMVEAFKQLGSSALTAAQGAGETAARLGGVGEGAKAATESMQASRDAFLAAADAAGIAKPQAEALANQIGLIPAAASTNFTSNATGVAAEMNTLAAQITAVPGAKQIVVDALSEEAQQKLRDLGFTVTTLPNGQVQVDVHDEAGRAKLDQFVAFANGQITVITADLNPDPATGKINATVQLGNGQTATMTYDARPDPATGKINATVDLGNGKTATMTLDARPDPATGKINGVVNYGNGQTTSISVIAKDNASATIDRIARPRTAVITVITEGANSVRNVPGTALPAGGGVFGYAGGGVHGFAGGGLRASRSIGMVVPGYAPGRDTVPALISKGESVLVPELTRLLGARRILAANSEASGGRPATTVGSIASVMDGLIGRTSVYTPGKTPPVIAQIKATVASPRGTGSAALASALASAVRASGTRQATEIAGLRAELVTVARAIRDRAPVVVQDQSGNPAETARATVLAMRL
jgi:hypothetical protein